MAANQFKNAQPPFYSPLTLPAKVLAAGSTLPVGGLVATQAIQVRNPNNTAMLIDQFKFVWPMALYTASDVSNIVKTSQLHVNIKLGAIPLTKEFVPVVALAPSYNPATITTQHAISQQQSYVWHLPRPIYCPPDVAISAQFTQFPFSLTTPGSAFAGPLYFIVVGRSLPTSFQRPNEIFVPWASHTRITSESVTRFVSGDSDLINPHDTPLKVTRFLGSLNRTMQSAGSFYDVQVPFTVRMALSSGKAIVRDPVPFYNLFTPSRRFFDVDGVLQAKEFVRAIVEQPAAEAGADPITTGMADLTIGMQGYRVLPTPQGSWT